MTVVTVGAGGVLEIGGRRVFPIAFSNGPYYDGTQPVPPPPPRPAPTPGGGDSLAELAGAGGTLLRTGMGKWTAAASEAQIAAQKAWLDAAAAHGLGCVVWLGDLPDLPARAAGTPPGAREQLLRNVVGALRGHPGLVAWKGIDEPANLYRGNARVAAAGMQRARDVIRAIDPDHPVLVTHAPRNVGNLAAYRPAYDICGVDVYPIAYPPGLHADDIPTDDLGIVGDVTRTIAAAAGPKPTWTTLQIAWSGVVKPGATLRFPTFAQQRFMAYDAIVAGARGLVFFGGHLTKAGDRPLTRQSDIAHGWNWTFWDTVLRRLVQELAPSGAVYPGLVAPPSKVVATATFADGGKAARLIELLVRETATAVFVFALKRGGTTTRVRIALPGVKLRAKGYVLGEEPRMVDTAVTGSGSVLTDWFAPWDVHVYKIGKA